MYKQVRDLQCKLHLEGKSTVKKSEITIYSKLLDTAIYDRDTSPPFFKSVLGGPNIYSPYIYHQQLLMVGIKCFVLVKEVYPSLHYKLLYHQRKGKA